MKKYLFLLFVLSLLIACKQTDADSVSANHTLDIAQRETDNAAPIQAFNNNKSDIFVEGTGVVTKLLPDDNKGSRHQKFLVTISPEQTLLFAHNVDLAPIVPLVVGDAIQFRGEYVYNPKGGVIHWTHRDPQHKIEGGWIKYKGKTYN